jgi:hypothetical protein
MIKIEKINNILIKIIKVNKYILICKFGVLYFKAKNTTNQNEHNNNKYKYGKTIIA